MARTNDSYRRRENQVTKELYYSYAEGNAVRKAGVPDWEETSSRPMDREALRRRARIRRNQQRAMMMSPGYIFFIALAAVTVLFAAVNYLKVQSSTVSLMEQIEAGEQKLEEMKADNALLERQLQTYVDLDYIYEVATTELGLVQPAADQIIHFDQVESEYVRQYDKIPK